MHTILTNSLLIKQLALTRVTSLDITNTKKKYNERLKNITRTQNMHIKDKSSWEKIM